MKKKRSNFSNGANFCDKFCLKTAPNHLANCSIKRIGNGNSIKQIGMTKLWFMSIEIAQFTVMYNLKIDEQEKNRFYVHNNLIECVSIEKIQITLLTELTAIFNRSLQFNTICSNRIWNKTQKSLFLSDRRCGDVTNRATPSITTTKKSNNCVICQCLKIVSKQRHSEVCTFIHTGETESDWLV